MKLSTKLIISLVAAAIATMAIHGYLSIEQDKENFSREIRVGMRGFSRAIQAALVGLYADNQDLKGTQEFIDRVGSRGNIHGLIVYDGAGKAVAVSVSLTDVRNFPMLDPAAVLQIDPRPVLRNGKGIDGYIRSPKQLVYYRVEPIFDSEHRLAGAFVLGRQGWALASTIESRRNRIIVTTAALVVVLCILVLILVRRNISFPIQGLMERIREIGRGHWQQRIEIARRDEVGALAEEFNRMGDRLQDTYARLIKEQEEKLKLERELRHSERLASVGQMAAGLAHEIGTPLNVIGGRAEYLLRRPRGPNETSENLHIIRSQIDRIAGIVRRLLEFSRRSEPAFRAVELPSLLSAVKALLQHKIEERGVEVHVDAPQSLPPIQADPDLLQQVFLNLYLNSLQVLGPRGAIKITARVVDGSVGAHGGGSEQGWLRISFEDNGPGIPPEHIERIFDPFFTTKDIGEGTGLGLSVTYGIVKDHGGEIRVESDPGRFTRFILDLPIASAPEGRGTAGTRA